MGLGKNEQKVRSPAHYFCVALNTATRVGGLVYQTQS
jgi:hypothetical protein